MCACKWLISVRLMDTNISDSSRKMHIFRYALVIVLTHLISSVRYIAERCCVPRTTIGGGGGGIGWGDLHITIMGKHH